METSIQNKINSRLKEFDQILADLPFENEKFYSLWLAQTFYFVEHSVPLLKEARKGDVNKTVYDVFEEHIREEDGHDILAIKDLEKHSGIEVSTLPKLDQTTRLYDRAYKGVQDKPASLIGYILALEFLASEFAIGIRDRVTKAHGSNKAKFLHVHGTEDQHHTQEMLKLVEACSEAEQQEIYKVLDDTFDNYMDLIEAIESNSIVGHA